MPATKVKSKFEQQQQQRASIASGDMIVDAKREEALAVEVAAFHLLQEIEQRVIGELVPNSVLLTPREERLLSMGGVEYTSIHDLIRLLECVRAARESYQEFSFDKLAAARQEVEEAKERLRTEQLQIGDLQGVNDTTEPVLVEQIKKLQSRLGELGREVLQAEFKVSTLLTHQKILENLAPQCVKKLRDVRNLELRATQEYQTFHRLKDEIRNVETLLLDVESPNGCFRQRHSWDTLIPYLVHNGVITQSLVEDGFEIDREIIARHLKGLREIKLPALRSQLEVAQKAFDEAKAFINPDGPIRAWVECGTISIDDLSQ
jgi:hypothetical protein